MYLFLYKSVVDDFIYMIRISWPTGLSQNNIRTDFYIIINVKIIKAIAFIWCYQGQFWVILILLLDFL